MLNKLIEELIWFGLSKNMIEDEDTYVVRNELFTLLNVSEPYELDDLHKYDSIAQLLNKILDAAVEQGIITDSLVNRDILDAKIMSKLMPRQSELAKTFYAKAKDESIEAATDYFYELSKNSNYIKMDRVSKNKYFTVDTQFGELEITINLSKPEKDPKDIEAAKHAKSVNYPKCFLCIENIGYEGRINHPARANHRVVPVDLDGDRWYLQYSPYVYYNEHAICFSKKHEDMKIGRKTFEKLLAFVEQFPHYFLGSNADLPIVGGSILSHDHFQGGNHFFPLEKADTLFEFTNSHFKNTTFSFVKWPLSVIKVVGKDKEEVIEASNFIYEKWRDYDDESACILSHSEVDGERVRHNTVTPIARKDADGNFVVLLTLRNNRRSEKHPLGIFHPHEEIHHIKKENIGLIEVMGLAVLPKRLDDDHDMFVDVLTGKVDVETMKENHHYDWLKSLVEKYGKVEQQKAGKIANDEVGKVFCEGLTHCGVFKQDETGIDAFKKFVTSVGFEL